MNIDRGTHLFTLPTSVEYGEGVARNVGHVARRLGAHKVLMVVDPALASSPSVRQMEQDLRDCGMRTAVLVREPGEPTDQSVQRGAEQQHREQADALVAIGGGSSIDTAKAIRILAEHGGKISDFEGTGKVPRRSGIRLIAVPTTAGTGSEVVGCAVVIDMRANKKIAVLGEHVAPDVALADPLLTCTLPPDVTAATGFDALAQAIGAFTVTISQPLADAYALYAVELIAAHLVRAVQDGSDVDARAGMLVGSLSAGIAMGGAECGLDHALAETIAVSYHVPHGLAVGIFLPYVVEFNAQAAPGRFARLAHALEPNARFESEAEASEAAVRAVRRLAADLRIPTLHDVGVGHEALPELAKDALQYGDMLRINPRSADFEDMLGLYELAY